MRADGHRVVALTLPGLSDGDDPRGLGLKDAVAHVVGQVQRLDLRDVTMIAHSWGGLPMTGAAHELRGRVRKLVYWSAFVPAEGRCLLDDAPPELVAGFRALAEASGNDTVTLPYDVWSEGFIQDAGADVRRLVYSLLVPQPFGYFTQPLVSPEPRALGIPTSYVISTEDVVLPPGEYGWTPRFPDRLGVTPIEAPGSHEALLTRPVELAEVLLTA